MQNDPSAPPTKQTPQNNSKFDPRDVLWEESFNTYYDAYYEERLAESILVSWLRVEMITKLLVAFTATGSAVSGGRWTVPGFREIWMILAAGAAVSSIILTVVDIPRHVADQSDTKGRFAALRTDIDTFRSLMRIDPNFPLEQFVPKFEGYRKRYSDNYQLLKNDFLGTRGREVKVQKQLNLLLSDKIITETKETKQ